jgi:hypothetical protein
MGCWPWVFLALGASCGCKMDQDLGGNATPSPGTQTRVVWDMKPGKVGEVRYEILDDATGKKMPGKLTFVGHKGTTDPRFSKGDIGREEADSTGVAAFNRVFSIDGAGSIPVPIGKYKITFSRGIEWTIQTLEAEVSAAGIDIKGRLKHVIDTPKWASGDFHVHAAASPDSRVPMRDRVYEFVAEGIDMIVSTDHNVVANYQPHIDELKMTKLLASARGDEISSGAWGHFGAFPLPADMEKEGPPSIRRKTAQQIFDAFRAEAPDAIINVHHPRLEKAIGYFWLGMFDNKLDRALRKGFSYDFDAVELLNGYQDTNRKSLDRTMEDWFSLLDTGHMVTATGNSDTHHMTYNLGGYPRNYVQVDNDDPGVVTGAHMAKGIKQRRVYFTTAPIIGFSSGTAGIGDIAPAPDGKAKLEIVVRAAPWVSVSRVKLYVGGKIAKTWNVDKSDAVERFKITHEIEVPRDTYAVVRVEGDAPLTPVVGGVGGGIPITPLALTNPIFFDKDGNKKYDPPHKHGDHLKDAKDDGDDRSPKK